MSLETIENLRVVLQEKQILLKGPSNTQEQEVLRGMRSIIEEYCVKIDLLFKITFDSEGGKFNDLFTTIYDSLGKSFLRYRNKLDKNAKLDQASFDSFWLEIQELISLFNEHGLKVDKKLLSNALIYGGLNYWKAFFQEEFEFFKGHISIVRRAIITLATDPRSFLKIIRVKSEEISREEEFADFAEMPWVFRNAAINSPSDPRGFLRRSKVMVQEILQEEEFVDIPFSTVVYSTINVPLNPRKSLRAYRLKYPPKKGKKPKKTQKLVESQFLSGVILF